MENAARFPQFRQRRRRRATDAIHVSDNIQGAIFIGAQLEGANIGAAQLKEASFGFAQLEGANFNGAQLERANFKGARLEGADFRESSGLILDDSLTPRTQFNIRAGLLDWVPDGQCRNVTGWALRDEIVRRGHIDPWSRLRSVYTGPKYFYHLLFLVAFLVPMVLNAAKWKAANEGQQVLGHVQDAVALELSELNAAGMEARGNLREELAARWAAAELPPETLAYAQDVAVQAIDAAGVSTQAELLAKVNSRVGGLQPCLQPRCGPARPMWYVLLGADQGWRPAFVAVLLILYNVGRFVITRAVGDMRDSEERTGWCPALRDYGPYYVAHKFMTGLFVAGVLGGLIHIGIFLFTDFVYLPL